MDEIKRLDFNGVRIELLRDQRGNAVWRLGLAEAMDSGAGYAKAEALDVLALVLVLSVENEMNGE